MGLTDGYGVLIGTKSNYFRDPPDDYGRYYHGNLVIHAPDGDYRCAIDVDPKAMPDGIQWRIARIRPSDFSGINVLADGWHPLASTPSSGALDYIRSPVLHPPIIVRIVRHGSLIARSLSSSDGFHHGTAELEFRP